MLLLVRSYIYTSYEGTEQTTSTHPRNLMKEALIYTFVGISQLILLAYVVHMFIGGLVSEETEHLTMAIVTGIGALAMGAMAWDVIKRRRRQRG